MLRVIVTPVSNGDSPELFSIPIAGPLTAELPTIVAYIGIAAVALGIGVLVFLLFPSRRTVTQGAGADGAGVGRSRDSAGRAGVG